MAELGHPVLGPASYWKLTPGEIRVYAEGMRVINAKQADSTHESSHQYNRSSHQQREEDALARMSKKARAAQHS